ncbi:D-alanyl-D-alanine carboxypeptidase family protein [Nonomuraea sp. NPDC047897]|uniref:D-alanyl-D-alanine carboxypeptidase family protein n=1 Tax=Nonomuraea sp. NPDC047897 TaxID=3364346 RepID=UPI003723A959
MHDRKAPLLLGAGALALITGLAAPAHARTATPQVPSVAAPAVLPADSAASRAVIDPPRVYGKAAILVDAETGAVRFREAENRRMPIASLTKTMTAYLVLKSAKPGDLVEVRPEDVRYARAGGGTTAYLRAGDRLPVKDMLYALMLPSGADAAHALARTYGPGVSGFVAKMNATARQLGMNDTSYVNADGLPMPGSDGYSTARDQAVLGVQALRDPLLRQVTSTRRHTAARTATHRSYTWSNTNKLLGSPGAVGLKTGFTRAAGFSLAFAGERAGRLLVGVLLGESVSSRRFDTARALLDWGGRVGV